MPENYNRTQRQRIRPTTRPKKATEFPKGSILDELQGGPSREGKVEILQSKKERPRKNTTKTRRGPVFGQKAKGGIDRSEAKQVDVKARILDPEAVRRHVREIRQKYQGRHDPDEALVGSGLDERAETSEVPPFPEEGYKPRHPGSELVVSYREVAEFRGIEPKFHRILDTPGYRKSEIRKLGRENFRNRFPTYATMEKMCREAGVDPLGQIRTIATVTSGHDAGDVRKVAAWILEHGTIIDTAINDHGTNYGVMNGYRPEEVVAIVDDRTYLLVHEGPECPMGEQYYIYSWSGGLVPCLENAGEEYSYETRRVAQIGSEQKTGMVIEASSERTGPEM